MESMSKRIGCLICRFLGVAEELIAAVGGSNAMEARILPGFKLGVDRMQTGENGLC